MPKISYSIHKEKAILHKEDCEWLEWIRFPSCDNCEPTSENDGYKRLEALTHGVGYRFVLERITTDKHGSTYERLRIK